MPAAEGLEGGCLLPPAAGSADGPEGAGGGAGGCWAAAAGAQGSSPDWAGSDTEVSFLADLRCLLAAGCCCCSFCCWARAGGAAGAGLCLGWRVPLLSSCSCSCWRCCLEEEEEGAVLEEDLLLLLAGGRWTSARSSVSCLLLFWCRVFISIHRLLPLNALSITHNKIK